MLTMTGKEGKKDRDISQIAREFEKAKAELWLLYEISNAMRTTLELEQILYIILTAVTSHEGLGFNRAMLFLVNKKDGVLEGKMGIGELTSIASDDRRSSREKLCFSKGLGAGENS